MAFYYSIFGLCLKCDFEIPQLLKSESKVADVTVVLGRVSDDGLNQPLKVKPCTQQKPGQAWLGIPNIAKFLIDGGSSITVEIDPEASQNEVSLYLLGTCLAVIAHQQNHSVIHGNVIRVGSQAVILAGDSGVGKSTLAAAFHQRGYDLVSDDLAVINTLGFVQPGYPSMKISPASTALLNIDTRGLSWVKRDQEKYMLPLVTGFYNKPLSVAGIYVLNLHEGKSLASESVEGANKLVALRKNTYRKGMLKGLGLKVGQMNLLSDLANRVFIDNIYRPKEGFEIADYLSFIERDLVSKGIEL